MSTSLRKAVLGLENICGPRSDMSVNPSKKVVFGDRVNTCIFEK